MEYFKMMTFYPNFQGQRNYKKNDQKKHHCSNIPPIIKFPQLFTSKSFTSDQMPQFKTEKTPKTLGFFELFFRGTLFSFGDSGHRSQGLPLARQALYHPRMLQAPQEHEVNAVQQFRCHFLPKQNVKLFYA
jgi:hypothetical protein